MFLKNLDEKQSAYDIDAELLGIESKKIFAESQQDIRWKNFKQFTAEKMFETVSKEAFKYIKTMHADKDSAFSKYMEDAIFIIPTPQMLDKIVTNIDLLRMDNKDAKGDLYEYLLSKVATAGTNGQFRTTRHIIDMMVKLMKPTPSDKVCDPACGSAGFLVSVGEYLQENHSDILLVNDMKNHYYNDMFYGYDMDRTMLRIGVVN